MSDEMSIRSIGSSGKATVSGYILATPEDQEGASYSVSANARIWCGASIAMQLQSRFRRWQCKQCGRVDEGRALLKTGLKQNWMGPRPTTDVHETLDYFNVWSRAFADHVSRLTRGDVTFAEIPGLDGFVVPWPKTLIIAPPKLSRRKSLARPTAAFHSGSRPCDTCGRRKSMTFHSIFLEPPADAEVFAVRVDFADHPGWVCGLSWFVSARVAKELRAMRYTNVRFDAP